MVWTAPFADAVASVDTPDNYTVHFVLKKPNARFHALFSVRWNAAWIMPKHIFEKVADVKGIKAVKKALQKGITLKKLPASGSYKISVVATTILKQKLTVSQTYKSCTKGSGNIGLHKPKKPKKHKKH